MPTKKTPAKGRPAELDPQHILDIAETLFAERGFDATTTRELARRSRCNVAMISYHFGSKEGLYQTLITRHFLRMHASFEETAREAATSPHELARRWPELADLDERHLCASLFGVAHIITLDNCMHKLLCREMMSGGKTVIQLLSKSDLGIANPILESLSSLVKKGKLKKDLNISLATICLLGPMVYSNIAAPVIDQVYGFKNDEEYARKLCVHLTKTLFSAWRS